MQDTAIAFILPNAVIFETVRKVLTQCGYTYPIFMLSMSEALEKARHLESGGTKIIITQGLTYQYLRRQLKMSVLELPFSGLEAALAIKSALSHSQRTIHMGTPQFMKYLYKSLELLGLDKSRVDFFQLTEDRPLEEQAQEMIEAGYEVIIGGFPTANYARQCGKIGVEFDVDERIIEIIVRNATEMVENLIREESRHEMINAIMNSVAGGIISVDTGRRIRHLNLTAKQILNLPADTALGLSLDEAMERAGVIDVLSLENSPLPRDAVKVVMKELPVIVGSQAYGSVVSISEVDEIHEIECKIRKQILSNGLLAKKHFSDITGISDAIFQAKERARTYAHYDSTVLITGETGTGKELFAQSIHNESRRGNHPFVAINCASLPENLIESELFGYVGGAFTGASREGRIGLFETAGNGTVFLDEISEMPLSMQAKLLRVLQEREIIRIGSGRIVQVNARIICSSNKNLLELVNEGKFKEDLYYRLCVLEVNIPPLRYRKEDIPLLANSLIRHLNSLHRRRISDIHPNVLIELGKMSFPGNVRELKNILERMVIMAEGTVIDESTYAKSGFCAIRDPMESSGREIGYASGTLKDVQHAAIMEALERTGGNKSAAARLLGINPTTLWRKLNAPIQ
jgi:transcriptional regulator with PAS, ATPase and Fis domain